jgi:hypothetical protein
METGTRSGFHDRRKYVLVGWYKNVLFLNLLKTTPGAHLLRFAPLIS